MFTKTSRALGFLKNSDIPQQLSQINITQTKHLILALCNNSPSPEQTLLPAVIAGAQCPQERQAGAQSTPTQASHPGGHQTLSILTAERRAPGSIQQPSVPLARLLGARLGNRAGLSSQSSPSETRDTVTARPEWEAGARGCPRALGPTASAVLPVKSEQ